MRAVKIKKSDFRGAPCPALRFLESACFSHAAQPRYARGRAERGTVLLEVVLALTLFVGAATIISAGINASVRSIDRVRLQNHAANLAITILSEMQMHARPITAVGPEPFAPPFQNWTFKIEVGQNEMAAESSESLRPVEVIVRHLTENVVHRVTLLFPASQIGDGGTDSGPLAAKTP